MQYKFEMMAQARWATADMKDPDLVSRNTMAEFDELCLAPIKAMAPEEIRELRLSEAASRTVFARYPNVTPGLVRQSARQSDLEGRLRSCLSS